MRYSRVVRTRGFSLGELMIVLAVISTMMAVILPSMSRAKAEGQLASCVENLKNIGAAYQSYLADHPGVKDLPTGSNPWTYLVPQYMRMIPRCPSSGASNPVPNGNGGIIGYQWIFYSYVDYEPYPYVMCLGAHNDILPASRGPWLGPVWSPRSGADDCRSGNPRY